MKPGKYSRWSIVIAAVAGIVLIVAGIYLLYQTDHQSDASASHEPINGIQR